MPNYRIHFEDGHTIDKSDETGTRAKLAAKQERRQQTGATEENDRRLKVLNVEDLEERRPAGWPKLP